MGGKLYSQPLRVYVLLGVLGLAGIICGLRLPISLFPNSSKPEINVNISYGGMTSSEFIEAYGDDFEQALRGIQGKTLRVETLESAYWGGDVTYTVKFAWGSEPDEARKEVQNVVSAWTSRFPDDVRDTVGVWTNNDNSGFFAASFYSDRRSLDETYELLDAAMKSRLAQIEDADQPELWNPARKEIRVQLKPEVMANLQLVPKDVEKAIVGLLSSRRGGSVTVGTNQLRVEMPRFVKKPEDLNEVPVVTPTGRVVHLSDVALVDFGPKTSDARIVKTSGAPSVILYASPRPGGNVKRMAEDLLASIDEARKSLPPDIHYKVLVDPSQFIRSAIGNVIHEVGLGALLAVSVLFIFIGSLRNVVTAAVEIPLSIVLAFILMRMTGVNVNMISLGGLALSAGMNVDGSVVVMENIFRHFGEAKGRVMTASERLRLLVQAVNEVRLPLIASTVASLVVFLPLTFTSALSYAILGDLAKAVVFSHGFSAVVALILVPTVRYHLMQRAARSGQAQDVGVQHSRFEPALAWLDDRYSRLLGAFMRRGWLKWLTYAGLGAALAGLIVVVLPKLPREVIGTPDSDMIFVSVNTKGNTVVKQMEAQSDEVERELLTTFGDKIQYSFTQINNPNRSFILARLVDKKDMSTVWSALEKHFVDTPLLKFRIEPWNPSELPIPDPPDLRVAVRGGDLMVRRDTVLELSDLLEANHVFDRVSMNPNVERSKGITLDVNAESWAALQKDGVRLTPGDLADISLVGTLGRKVAHMAVNGRQTDIMLRYPDGFLESPEDLAALPVGLASKVVPLKALLPMRLEESTPPVYRENGQDLFVLFGRQNRDHKAAGVAALAKARQLLADWQAKQPERGRESRPVVAIEDAGKDVTEAINQLGMAIGISVVLIFVVLLLQFGSVAESLLVLVAVPLGFIGVILALYLGHSTLSLNSALGVILLNGIAVNNSIIMVDFIRRLCAEGLAPRQAALVAARKRLRPILITSLTTILGMLPIAFGFGEGGRILQPLGIAVSGGLWISMGLTLFLVPALQVSWLERRGRGRAPAAQAGVEDEGLALDPRSAAVHP